MATSYKCAFVQKLLCFGLLLLITLDLSDQSVLNVNRRANGDSILVNGSTMSCLFGCDKYSAVYHRSTSASSCMCKCSGTKPKPTLTFYGKKSMCMTNDAIAKDNSCDVIAKDGPLSSSLLLLDTNMTAPRELTLQNIPINCIDIRLKWSYYDSSKWNFGTQQNIFSISYKYKTMLPGSEREWILKISDNLPQSINGLLVKLSMQYNLGDGFNPFDVNGCIIFKVLGHHKVTPRPPITIPPTTVAAPTTASPSTGSTQKQTPKVLNTTPTIQTGTEAPTILSTTISKNPKKEPSKAIDQRLLIAFATGGVTLLIVLFCACVGIFIFVRSRRRRKAKKAASVVQACTRPPVPLPPGSPPHDYEYVVYPADTLQPSTNSLDNAMYGRGPDNELIIRTPAISRESLISKHTNNSTKSNNSTLSATLIAHDYTHLQGKDKDNDKNSIYQPLIRPHTPSDQDNYIERPQIITGVKDNERPVTLQTDEGKEPRPTTYMEPCNDGVPEYMELEPVKSNETTV